MLVFITINSTSYRCIYWASWRPSTSCNSIRCNPFSSVYCLPANSSMSSAILFEGVPVASWGRVSVEYLHFPSFISSLRNMTRSLLFQWRPYNINNWHFMYIAANDGYLWNLPYVTLRSLHPSRINVQLLRIGWLFLGIWHLML